MPAPAVLRCKRPACAKELPRSTGRGKPRLYCPGCKELADKEYAAALRQLNRAQETVAQFRRDDISSALLLARLEVASELAREVLDWDPGSHPDWRFAMNRLLRAIDDLRQRIV
jgi:hypothetical protein